MTRYSEDTVADEVTNVAEQRNTSTVSRVTRNKTIEKEQVN